MELRHLRYFLAVAEERHFGRAALKLHIVQPALSMQIRSFEEELGTALFTRTSRSVELTGAGEVLVQEARRTLEQAERAKDLVQRSARGEVGSVRIAFSGNASFVGKLSGDLQAFHKLRPIVEISLREASPLQQADLIRAGEVDIGYCPSFDGSLPRDLSAESVGKWPWVLALGVGHMLAGRSAIRTSDLLAETFILYAADDAEVAQRDLIRRLLGREPKVAHSVGNTLTVLTMAAAGLGVSLVPAPLATVSIPGLCYRPLKNLSSMSDLLLLTRRGETSGAVNAFLAMAKDETPRPVHPAG